MWRGLSRGRAGIESLDTNATRAPDAVGVTERVLLLADSQLQYPYGAGTYTRTPLADLYVGTAIRPAQLDMFSDVLLLDACRRNEDRWVIHLGDAANAGCVQEWRRFTELMQECRPDTRAWVMAPGNHDAYFLGNTDTECDANAEGGGLERGLQRQGEPPHQGRVREGVRLAPEGVHGGSSAE